MSKPEQKLVRFDWAMKNILRDKANFDVLEGFLTSLLGEKIIVKGFIGGKHKNMIEYIASNGTTKIVSVDVIYNSRATDGDDYIYHGKSEMKGLHTGKNLVARQGATLLPEEVDVIPEYYFLCVGNFKSNRIKAKIDEWMYFFKTEAIKADFDAPGIKEVEEKFNYLSMTKAERNDYDAYMDMMHYERSSFQTAVETADYEGERRGRAEGELKAKLETAKNMLESGVGAEQIAEGTGLSAEKIRELKNA